MINNTDSIHTITKKLSVATGPFVLLSVGVPGSGKTTVLSKIADNLNIKRICPDDIREELTGSAADQSVNAQAWDIANTRIKSELVNGRSVIIDATHAEAHRRKEATQKYRTWGAVNVLAIVFVVGLETAKHRNTTRERIVPEHAIEKMYQSIRKAPPGEQEGIDKIIHLEK